ncbi:P-loop containing nucleoside triphosphate hydrolase protein [Mycotypha africana]|uniref:P-loop containing nucleoside triphosphate hydrolase protein n=1 Tax=Mycotypha africana TaxID=64632 RepID=UPI00230072C2|nr:P-loop containing nucleoside triphosphate hydrolase protein [Mycotypha africana]KAI8988304.1 P-loop containing nucleoside triphosphate hydrolase protein [Mycotypha africana]
MPVRRIRSDSEEEEEDRANFNSSTVANKRATYANADDDSDTKEAQQPRPSKRAKITSNDNAEASSDEVDDQEEETDGMDVENIPRHSIIDDPPKPLEFGDDGYVEGSIVKMILVNFVTYDYCEIFPGPQMNMIIGPNGTGKSTIVCAIALGLGGSPNLLGRAKNVAEFVKTGQDEAQITIELKRVNSRNVILQRTLRKSNNATSWRLNGKQATQKEVFSLIQSFNIQVDNLCQFLPQDRVAEFAELSPPQLLQRTQIAAGKFDLADMQKQLMEWRNEEKQLSRTNSSDIDHLKTLKTRNSELEKDVRRSEELKKIYETEKEKTI